MKVIFDTNNCYEGYSEKLDCWVVGSYLYLSSSTDIDESSIQWSEMTYEDEISYIQKLIEKSIRHYEKRYRTTVRYLGIVGRLGLWNGNPVGGRIIYRHQNPLQFMGDVDRIEVTLDEDGLITILGHHHDGTHEMNLYVLTDNKLKKIAPNFFRYGESNYKDMERIYEELYPLRIPKKDFVYYAS